MSDIDLDLLPSKAKRTVKAKGPMPFSEFFDVTCKEWFDTDTWSVWRVVGKALFAEPLTDDERLIFKQFTGRDEPPTERVREFWGIIGRRGGKGSFVAAVAVYLALYNPPTLKKGTLGRVLILAVDKDQASEVFGYIDALIEMTGNAKQVKTKSKESIELKNRIEIMVKPADRRRVRGRTLVAVIADEISSWWSDEASANPDVEVLRALRPGMLGVKGAMLFAISSPFARKGALYDTFAKSYGQPDPRTLVWKAATWEQRPSDDEDFVQFLEDEEKADPVSFRAEYGGEFRDDIEQFVTIETLDRVTVPGRLVLPYQPGVKFWAAGDLAGGEGADSAALVIVKVENGIAVLCRLDEWRPPFNSVDLVRSIVSICEEYGCREIETDNFGGAIYKGIFREVQPSLAVKISEQTTTQHYANLIPMLTGQKVALLDHPRLRGQLLSLERHVTQQGREIITHPKAKTAHDDCATATALGLGKAAKASRQFESIVWHATRSTVRKAEGEEMSGKRATFLGGGMYRSQSGELFRDPRGI